MSKPDKVHGEGNYDASRQYNDATKRFVEAGKVDEAARKARPADKAEARDLENAEAAGRSRAKEEDPALRGDAATGETQGDSGGTRRPSPSPKQSGNAVDRNAADRSAPDQPQAPMPGKE